jgi:hypothetical protein
LGFFQKKRKKVEIKIIKDIVNTRKTSRINTNADSLHFLLISSDPLITSKRTLTENPKIQLSINALDLVDVSKETDKESDSETISETYSE